MQVALRCTNKYIMYHAQILSCLTGNKTEKQDDETWRKQIADYHEGKNLSNTNMNMNEFSEFLQMGPENNEDHQNLTQLIGLQPMRIRTLNGPYTNSTTTTHPESVSPDSEKISSTHIIKSVTSQVGTLSFDTEEEKSRVIAGISSITTQVTQTSPGYKTETGTGTTQLPLTSKEKSTIISSMTEPQSTNVRKVTSKGEMNSILSTSTIPTTGINRNSIIDHSKTTVIYPTNTEDTPSSHSTSPPITTPFTQKSSELDTEKTPTSISTTQLPVTSQEKSTTIMSTPREQQSTSTTTLRPTGTTESTASTVTSHSTSTIVSFSNTTVTVTPPSTTPQCRDKDCPVCNGGTCNFDTAVGRCRCQCQDFVFGDVCNFGENFTSPHIGEFFHPSKQFFKTLFSLTILF